MNALGGTGGFDKRAGKSGNSGLSAGRVKMMRKILARVGGNE
jgi:hypothetical protein